MIDPLVQQVNPFSQVRDTQQTVMNHIQQHLTEQVIAVFCNPQGLQLLDTLDDMYLRQPVCPPGCAEGYGYMREGENQLIRKIRRIVNIAQQKVNA